MSKITDLRRYQESDEWKKILKKCNNKVDALSAKLLQEYEDKKIKNLSEFSNHDVNYARLKVIRDVVDQINSTEPGAILIKEQLEEDIDRIKKFTVRSIRDDMGIPHSGASYTKLDMVRFQIADNYNIGERLEGLIAAEEKTEEQDTAVYEDKPNNA